MTFLRGWALLCLLSSCALAQFPQIQAVKFVSGFIQPAHITNAGDGSGRLFVVEQPGRIRIIQNGSALPAPFLDIAARVSCCGERGLLSVAFPPGFATKRDFYVYYTALTGDVTISRFRLTADANVADPTSETVLLSIDHRQFANHNGGQLAFGLKDGFLYIGTGDGGGAGDTLKNTQNTGSLLGKLLRIDVESGATPYAIPSDNPLVNRSGARGEIWAFGLRNPWRFSFDRANADLYIGDVGQDKFEEINFQPAASGGGQNYGWPVMEGLHCFQGGCDPSLFTPPVAEYDHSQGDCSVAGGFVYRGARFPQMQGTYFFGDFCSGRIRALQRSGSAFQSALLLNTGVNISSFGEDEAGELYFTDVGAGDVYSLVAAGPSVVNAASFESGIVPGSIATIFGSGLTTVTGVVSAPKGPLPREIGGASVTVNGIAAPLFAAANVNGQQQLNIQVPFEVPPGGRATLVVNNSGSAQRVDVDVLAVQPALFTTDGVHAAALHNADFQVIGPQNAAAADEVVALFGTGLGPVTNPPATGDPAPDSPLSQTASTPEVTIAGRSATVLFSGLAPQFAGLYQLNVRVPAETPAGDQDIVVTAGGRTGKPVKLPVR